MAKIKCEKCQFESEIGTKFCSQCGAQLSPQKVRTLEEIERMEGLLDQARKLRLKQKSGSPMDLIFMLVTTIVFEWVKGKNVNPIEMVLTGNEFENSEEAKALIELAKMYN